MPVVALTIVFALVFLDLLDICGNCVGRVSNMPNREFGFEVGPFAHRLAFCVCARGGRCRGDNSAPAELFAVLWMKTKELGEGVLELGHDEKIWV